MKSNIQEHSLTDQKERLELILDVTGVGIWDWQIQTDQLVFNERWAEIIGYTVAELAPIQFSTWASNVHPDDLTKAQGLLKQHWAGELERYELKMRMRHKDGHYVWVMASGKTVQWDADGNPLRMIGTHLDVTLQTKNEEDLLIAMQLLNESQNVANVGGWELNLVTGQLYWTDETYRIHETSPEEFNPTVDAGVGHFLPDSRERISQALDAAINQGIGYDLELETYTTKGRKIDVRTTCNVTRENDVSVRLTGIFQDISQQKNIQRKLEKSNRRLETANKALKQVAHYDALTGLPNRNLLADRIAQAMAKSQRHKKVLVIAFVDLDGFKEVNDSHGHSVGDELLKKITEQLLLTIRDGDTLSRIGGDEFVVVIDDLAEPEDCQEILNRMLEAVASTYFISGKPIQVSASIGVTYYPQDIASPDQLIRHADQAMYVAKQLGKNRYHVFDLAKDVEVKTRQEELKSIKAGLKNNEFVLYYQPKIDLMSKQVIGVEALIRWQHPERGLLAPGLFLPYIEHDILGIELGEWVIKTALKQLRTWQADNIHIPISVNISPLQLQHDNFVKRLTKQLKASPTFIADSLELEILESSALKNIELVSNIIQRCNDLGVVFSIDDFGTGYSSLTYLKRLPTKYLKIDQSFVIDMLEDTEDAVIIQGIIQLAKAFNLKVIAEGVETAEHGKQLLQLGCYLAQGYGIAKPMPIERFSDWLADWQHNPTLTDNPS